MRVGQTHVKGFLHRLQLAEVYFPLHVSQLWQDRHQSQPHRLQQQLTVQLS